MATIIERADMVIKSRAEWLTGAEEAKRLVSLLPTELQALDGEGDCYAHHILTATFSANFNPQIDLLKVAKMAGVQGLAPKMLRPDSWFADGEIALPNGGEARIKLRSLPAPSMCRIEEYQETITKYRAICPETGEEIK